MANTTLQLSNPLFDRKHIREYLGYGFLSALVYCIPVCIFLSYKNYDQMWIVFGGSSLFMLAILVYTIRLARRSPDYKSSWMMIIAAIIAVLVGIVIAVIFTFILCFAFIPGFMSGDSTEILQHAPAALNNNNSSLVMTLFVCATIENFGAAGFIAVLGPFVFKRNQTKDKGAGLAVD